MLDPSVPPGASSSSASETLYDHENTSSARPRFPKEELYEELFELEFMATPSHSDEFYALDELKWCVSYDICCRLMLLNHLKSYDKANWPAGHDGLDLRSLEDRISNGEPLHVESSDWRQSDEVMQMPQFLWDISKRQTINTKEFVQSGSCPDYAIVSHTWGRW